MQTLIERMAKKKAPASWISEVKKMQRTIKNLQDDKSHYLGVIDTLAKEKEQLEIALKLAGHHKATHTIQLELENQELRELFVYFFGENYEELAGGNNGTE